MRKRDVFEELAEKLQSKTRIDLCNINRKWKPGDRLYKIEVNEQSKFVAHEVRVIEIGHPERGDDWMSVEWLEPAPWRCRTVIKMDKQEWQSTKDLAVRAWLCRLMDGMAKVDVPLSRAWRGWQQFARGLAALADWSDALEVEKQ